MVEPADVGDDPQGEISSAVERVDLHRLLDAAGGRRICAVLGTAGWGKSTAVATWSRNRTTAWMRCDGRDLEPSRFVADLREAVLPYLGPGSADAGPAVSSSAWAAVSALCTRLGELLSEDLLLVIDDAHVAPPDGELAELMEILVREAPERLHVVLVSRRELPFPTARLRGRGQLAEIDAPSLAFDADEIETLLRLGAGSDAVPLAGRVLHRTGGWPAAVHSAIELIRAAGPAEAATALERLVRPGERFHAYLTEEVLAGEPPSVIDLLRRMAVYGEVGPAEIASCGVPDALATVADLVRRGLAQRSAEDPSLFSLVAPLDAYFEHDSTLTVGDRTLLRISAAQMRTAREDHAGALRHLIAAGTYGAAAALLLEHGADLTSKGRIDAVLEASRLSPPHLEDPRVLGVLGHALQVRGRWSDAVDRFRDADRGDVLDPALAWRIGSLELCQGEIAEVLGTCGRAPSPAVSRADPVDDVRVAVLRVTALRATGKLEDAGAELARAEAIGAGPQARAGVLYARALLATAGGRRREADTDWSDAVAAAESAGDLTEIVWIRCGRARHRLDVGAVADAAEEAAEAAATARELGTPFLLAMAATVRGCAVARLGRLEEAQQSLNEAVEILLGLGSRFLARPLCGLGDLYRIRGATSRARRAFEEAFALSESAGDVYGTRAALIGLARVRAEDDPGTAAELADRACTVGADNQLDVPAFLARGWIALLGGDREAGARDAARAEAAARLRWDRPGVAESMTLATLAGAGRPEARGEIDQAVEIYRDAGCPLEEAVVRIVSGRSRPGPAADGAEETLRVAGVDPATAWVVGPASLTTRIVPPVSIRALGPFQVIRDGRLVPRTAWQSRKARDVLKILVARRRPVPREQLIELLWPEGDPTRAGNRLSVLLSMLRDVLDPSDELENLVTTDGGAVGLNLGQVHVDIEQFLSDADAALAADREGRPDAAVRLAATVAAYTGSFLEDDPFPDWVTSVGEHLRAMHIALLQALTRRLQDADDVDGVVRATLRLLDEDPYDETAHLTLVDVLNTAGRRGEARRHYQRYVQKMGEIGVDPRAMDPTGAAPGAGDGPAPPEPRRRRPPRQPT